MGRTTNIVKIVNAGIINITSVEYLLKRALYFAEFIYLIEKAFLRKAFSLDVIG
jgi:hypothetical protein